MKLKILIGILLIVGLVGCKEINPNQIVGQTMTTYILADGRVVCRVDATKVFFDNKTGYVQESNRFGFAKEINRSWNKGGGIYFHPGEKLIICSNIDYNSGNCNNTITEVQLECSWCLRLDNDYKLIDEETSCLSSQAKRIIEIPR